jgi:outer membrane receptor protein involved in Fe transport
MLGAVLAIAGGQAVGAGIPTLDVVEVTAGSQDLVGEASSATQGTVLGKQLETRALMRPGEVLEIVPGVIVTQHAGDGKANQYFLRGFNLDHGTDFFTSVNGIPVNMPTHAHGQGYTDLNFVIPELVERVRYRKGPYSAEDGDFAAAGAAHMEYYRSLPADFAEVGAGENGFRRALLAGSPAAAGGKLLYGIEWYENDGPWQVAQHYGKFNGVLRYSRGSAADGFALTGQAYRGQWTSTDQVARRAIESGAIDRFGTLDPSAGGSTHRYSLGLEWGRADAAGATRANAYWVDYRLNLFSNFTYFLNDPVNGDQFEQADRRKILGAAASHTWFHKLAGRSSDTSFGALVRQDRIDKVGLHLTAARTRLSTVREDDVTQRSLGVYLQNQTQWLEKFRSIVGWRQDFYRFEVDSDLPANSGRASDRIGSPKLALIFGPWARTEFYANWGWGFHSNDARGSTITVDPSSGDPVSRVDPLVRAKGAELGVRSAPLPGLQLTAAAWQLELDSELLFVGDAGTTEASRPSKRRGVELAAWYHPLPWLTIDADASFSRARFTDGDPAGDRIPGAIERVLSVGVGVDGLGPWFGGLRLRHFGTRPLIEDDSVRSRSSTLANLRVGYRLSKSLQATLDVLNLFDREVSDIEYFYCSRLGGEAPGVCADGSAGTDDIHLHPAEPRTLRVALRYNF